MSKGLGVPPKFLQPRGGIHRGGRHSRGSGRVGCFVERSYKCSRSLLCPPSKSAYLDRDYEFTLKFLQPRCVIHRGDHRSRGSGGVGRGLGCVGWGRKGEGVRGWGIGECWGLGVIVIWGNRFRDKKSAKGYGQNIRGNIKVLDKILKVLIKLLRVLVKILNVLDIWVSVLILRVLV